MNEEVEVEVIERLINRCNECKFATCENCEINWVEVQAIGKMLERYKYLEEENKNYKIINETLNNICNSLEKSQKFLNNEFEEINKKVKELRIDRRR